LESNDSGNEDSDNFVDQQQAFVNNKNDTTANNNNNNINTNNNNNNNNDISVQSRFDGHSIRPSKERLNELDKMNPLNEQIMALSIFNERDCKPIQDGLIESLPTEGRLICDLI
jgi:hypothetical protein